MQRTMISSGKCLARTRTGRFFRIHSLCQSLTEVFATLPIIEPMLHGTRLGSSAESAWEEYPPCDERRD